ncbi:hypothetical protein C8R45DRAFT_96327 [Mycena sanguinolenta]|nr:hypothetical protein C8R45DRAFT_96327 [Mycena sanguinolenta]
MYFHNAATHCHPRTPSVAPSRWAPFSLAEHFPSTPVHKRHDGCPELFSGSEALPRPSKPSPRGRIHFQPPSNTQGRDTTTYVLSWPPAVATKPSGAPSNAHVGDDTTTYISPAPPTPIISPRWPAHRPAASSAYSNSSFGSMYYTPFTSPTSAPSTPELADDTALASTQIGRAWPMADVSNMPIRKHRDVAKPKGWARLRAKALTVQIVNSNTDSNGMNCLVESEDEEGLDVLLLCDF